jgi:LacI family transcriptional regulator
MRQYLSRGQKLPTAFFADNDMIALGAVKAMTDMGIRVPEDVSVVGFDDLPFSSISAPPLTTLRVPKQEMGRVAVRRIAELIKTGENLCLKQQVLPMFIERDSVRSMDL